MKIDAHHHLWDLQAVHYPWLMDKGGVRFFGDPASIQRDYLIDEFTADAKVHGIAGSVHIQVGAQDGYQEARWIDKVAHQNSWAMKQVAFCDLTADDVEAQLDKLISLSSVVGVRQIIGRAPGEDATTGTQQLISSAAFQKGLQSLIDRHLTFDLQLLPELMRPVADILKDKPQLRVALCHAGSPYDRSDDGITSWAEQLESLSSMPQIYAKLSGLGMFAHGWEGDDFRPITSIILEQFGAERVMFGSNFPVDSLTSDYHKLFTAYEKLIPQPMQDQVFGKTAADFYRF